MNPDDPRHGTYAGAQAHGKAGVPECEPCERARRRYQSTRANLRKMGFPGLIPTAPVTTHVQSLIAGGMTMGSVAERAGVSVTTVRDAGAGKTDVMLADTAAALLGVMLKPRSTGRIDATGTRRRLQALATLGWSQPAIVQAAEDMGISLNLHVVKYVMRGLDQRVWVKTAEGVAAVYEHLSMRVPTEGAPWVVRAVAQREHYAPPLAWDDIDDPDEQPSSAAYQATRGPGDDLADEWDHLRGLGVSIHQAAIQLGVTVDAIQTAERRRERNAA